MKYVLEIEDEPVVKDGVTLFKAAGFNSLVFDRNGLNKLKPYDPFIDRKTEIEYERNDAYQQGLVAGWLIAKKAICETTVSDKVRMGFFNSDEIVVPSAILERYTVYEAIKKLKDNEIAVGDVIEDESNGEHYLVVKITDTSIYCISGDDFEPVSIGRDYAKCYRNLHDRKDMDAFIKGIGKANE